MWDFLAKAHVAADVVTGIVVAGLAGFFAPGGWLAPSVMSHAADAAAAIGIPWAVFLFIRRNIADRRAAEEQTFDGLAREYTAWLMFCMANPRLDIGDYPDNPKYEYRKFDAKRERLAFTYLIGIFERAFLMYLPHEREFRERQWRGWESYIIGYCKRPNFAAFWRSIRTDSDGSGFDRTFEEFMDRCVERATRLDDKRPPSRSYLNAVCEIAVKALFVLKARLLPRRTRSG